MYKHIAQCRCPGRALLLLPLLFLVFACAGTKSGSTSSARPSSSAPDSAFADLPTALPPDTAPAAFPGTASPPDISLLPLPALDTETAFKDIKDKIWRLVELRIGSGATIIDRSKMDAAGQGGFYVIQFTNEGINGQAAPNRYFAAYNVQITRNVTLQTLVSTQQSTTVNIGGLLEPEYYYYLQRINRWELRGGQLHLYAPLSPDGESVLIYQ
jgi:hypothetical protein